MNVGVVFFCRPRRYLAARTALDEARLEAFAPGLDAAEVRSHLDAMTRIAAGDPEAGPVARLEQSERFHWLVAPSSTMIQTSPVHTGLCEDPEETLDTADGEARRMREIAPGLHYWTAAHPSWDPVPEPESPADWPEHVGSVLFEAPRRGRA